MATEVPAGGYAYVPGVFQYSAGVRALPGFRIERVRFRRVVPMQEGWRQIAAFLRERGRPLTAFCACELRSPAPFSEEGFLRFNQAYAKVLAEWGVMRDGANPVARSNVCPELDKPAEPGFRAFCFTAAGEDEAPSFMIAGSGEAEEGKGNYRDHTVRLGETSSDAMREKAAFVVGEMTRRMEALRTGWAAVTGTQAYTVHEMADFVPDLLVARGAMSHGLTWHFARPPVVGLEYEMDCRGIAVERVIG